MADPRLHDPALVALLDNPEDLAFWQRATGGQSAPSPALELALARDILAAKADVPPEALHRFRASMLDRAASSLRAKGAALSHGPFGGLHDGAIDIGQIRHAHRGFFGVEVMDLRHRRYDGTMSANMQREVWVSTDVVTVLPYDPKRDLVLVVEQIRSGPIARGGGPAWLLESVAGRIDAGETPEAAALRETREEAGLEVRQLLPIGSFYPSPGTASEYAYNYIALCELAEGASLHGLAEEGEDIRALTLPFNEAFAMIAGGEIQTAPLMISLLWLKSHRETLI